MATAGVFQNRLRSEPGWKAPAILSGLIVLIRLAATTFMGMMPQDAYYDFYAQHLALSYYDHPPMIGYLLRIFTSIFGKNVFALKLADTTVTILTVFAFFSLAKKFLSLRRAYIATLILLSTFMVSILSLISTPDVPLMLCWTLSLSFLYEAIFNNKKVYWVWSGIFSGLSFDSKYTGIFLIIGLIGFLLFSSRNRKWLYSIWFILYLILFCLVISPVFYWNFENGFASFKFQSEGRVSEGLQIDAMGFFGVIGHQAAILLPVLFVALILGIYKIVRKYKLRLNRIPTDIYFLLCFFIPLFIGFFVLSFVYWVKLNWMMPCYISGIIWISRYWSRKWLRYQLITSLIIHIALVFEIVFYFVPIRSDDTWFGWPEFASKVEIRRKDYPRAFIFSSDDYKTSSVLNFFLNEMVYAKNIVGERALQYDFIGTRLADLNGRDAIFINSNPRFTNLKNENDVPDFYLNYFDKIIPMDPILVEKNGKVERKFSVFLCKNYHFRPR